MKLIAKLSRAAGLGLCVVAFAGTAFAGNGKPEDGKGKDDSAKATQSSDQDAERGKSKSDEKKAAKAAQPDAHASQDATVSKPSSKVDKKKAAPAPKSSAKASSRKSDSSKSTKSGKSGKCRGFAFTYTDGHSDAGIWCAGNDVTSGTHVGSLHISCSDDFTGGFARKSDLQGHRVSSWRIYDPETGADLCGSSVAAATKSDKPKAAKPAKSTKSAKSGKCRGFAFTYTDGHSDAGVWCAGNDVTGIHVGSLHISCSDDFTGGFARKSDLQGHQISSWRIYDPETGEDLCGSSVASTKKEKEDKGRSEEAHHHVIVCHRTGSDSNPYVVINIPLTAWNGAHKPGAAHPTLNGRDDILLKDPASGPGSKDGFKKEDCVAPAQPPIIQQQPTDVCPNVEGMQTSVPTGMVKDAQGNCGFAQQPNDLCPNIEGVQTGVPAGLTMDAQGNCVVPAAAAAADICPNIEGVQTAVPAGLMRNADGNCVTPAAPAAIVTAEALVGGVAGAVAPAPAAKKESAGGVLGAIASAPEAIADTAATGTLPFTGFPLWIAVLIAVAVLATGLMLRRRTTA